MPVTPGDTGEFIEVSGRRLHYRYLSPELPATPVVFLHEGLGSVELWRDFPDAVVAGSHHPGLVYSRYGSGWSAPLRGPRQPDYMHEEALRTLPEIVERLVGRPPILVGHSDGASIALIYAGSGYPVAGLVLLAPHVFVEPVTVDRISTVRDEFLVSDMAVRMGRYHTEPDTTFRGWADIWLNPEFLSWNIEEYLPSVLCPILLIQGDADEFGTILQLEAVDAAVPGAVEISMVEGAGHSPHLSHPELVAETVVHFIGGLA